MLMTKKNQLLSMCLSAFAGHIIGSMLIKSIGLHIYYGTPFEVLIMRVPLYLAIGTLESMIIYMLLKNKAFSAQLDKVCNYGNKL